MMGSSNFKKVELMYTYVGTKYSEIYAVFLQYLFFKNVLKTFSIVFMSVCPDTPTHIDNVRTGIRN